VGSDHCPVFFHCPRHVRTARPKRQRTARWRLDALQDPEVARAYADAVSDAAVLCPLMSISVLPARGDTDAAEHASAQVATVLLQAASDNIGCRVVVSGVSKRGLTREVKHACAERRGDERRDAYRAYMDDPSPHRQADLERLTADAKRIYRESTAREHARQEWACVGLWKTKPGSHRAHQALARLARKPDTAPIATLVHPVTGAMCMTAQDKADALACHYGRMAQSQSPSCAEEERQHTESEATAQAEVKCSTWAGRAQCAVHCGGSPRWLATHGQS
jgi:hypothetical protein